MNLAVALRTNASNNLFRNALISAINSGVGDTAYLCSGFFQENHGRNHYRVSNDGNLIRTLAQNRINLVTVGVYNAQWRPAYDRFVSNLRHAGISVVQRVASRWHAKVFILDKGTKSIFGIIGSSNLTRRAFGISDPFNYECDVYLWDKKEKKIDKTLKELIDNYDDKYLIKSEYLLRENKNLSINDKLKEIKILLSENSRIVEQIV